MFNRITLLLGQEEISQGYRDKTRGPTGLSFKPSGGRAHCYSVVISNGATFFSTLILLPYPEVISWTSKIMWST
jgi:hypothetical protein